MKRIALLVVVALELNVMSLHAHHSRYGVYQTEDKVEIDAVLTRIKWSNPHVQFDADVIGKDGKVQNWKIEATAISTLRTRGIDRAFLREGDEVRIAGYLATSGKPEMLAYNLLLADGTEVLIDLKAEPYFTSTDSNKLLESAYDAEAKENAEAKAEGIFRVWSTVLSDPASFPMFKGGYPLTELAQTEKENWQPDPQKQLNCWAKDMPLLMVTPHPFEFTHQGDHYLMRFEEDDAQRLIHMNNSNQANEITSNSMGYSVGSWQGNTLVVETSNIDAQAFDDVGTPISNDFRLVERFSLSEDQQRLDYQVTYFDSETFTEPFELNRYWVWRPERSVQSWDCD